MTARPPVIRCMQHHACLLDSRPGLQTLLFPNEPCTAVPCLVRAFAMPEGWSAVLHLVLVHAFSGSATAFIQR